VSARGAGGGVGGGASAPGGAGPGGAGEVIRIAASMVAVCAAGALVLGGVFVATERYAEESRRKSERDAVTQMLGLDAGARVQVVSQYLGAGGDHVVYRTAAEDGAAGRELIFTLDGRLVREGKALLEPASRELRPLGRVFVARRGEAPAGFLVEGEARGYKNRIRFFVALDPEWNVRGVRVVEHEEDPGLGAEVATPWFQEQYAGRSLADVPSLDVTRDPMPEDWRGALLELGRLTPSAWQARHGALRERESDRPIYAVTGATISSRALTDGVRATVLHFRKRWELIGPYLEGRAGQAAVAVQEVVAPLQEAVP
jgi:electron transport complex protein RnfG